MVAHPHLYVDPGDCMLTLARLLGPGEVRDRAGAVVPAAAWRTTKTFDLFRVLALAEGQPVSMNKLMHLFWPTADAERASTSLRTATSQMRKVLGADTVERVGTGLALRGVWVDVAAYRALVGRIEEVHDQPAQVIHLAEESEALYGGDLDVADADCRVLTEARDELRRQRIQVLLDAAAAAGRCADWHTSLDFARRAATVELSDRSTRAVMRAWFAMGETARCVEEFERLRRHLADTYGIDPSAQTRAQYLQVVRSCAEWPPRETTVGREREIGQVRSALEGFLLDPDGPAGVVWLVGEPGSGRETVARDAARSLMLPLAYPPAGAEAGAILELFPDQGALTPGLVAMLQRLAEDRHRVAIVPVSRVPEGGVGGCGAVVEVPPLGRADFRRLVALVLQAEPTDQLAAELHAVAGGLPGKACRDTRRRLEAGDLTWTPEGVDAAPSTTTRRAKALRALATIPFVFLGVLGGESGVLVEATGIVTEERGQYAPLARVP